MASGRAYRFKPRSYDRPRPFVIRQREFLTLENDELVEPSKEPRSVNRDGRQTPVPSSRPPTLPLILQQRAAKAVGALNVPLEVFHEICRFLDLGSLDNLKLTSVACEVMVNSLLPLHRLQQHAPLTMRLMRLAGVLKYFTAEKIYNEFIYPWCRICGNFGQFLFLPTATRCCHDCHHYARELRVIPCWRAVKDFALPLEALDQITAVNTAFMADRLPEPTEFVDFCTYAVDVFQAKQVALNIHGSSDQFPVVREQRQYAYHLDAQSQREEQQWATLQGLPKPPPKKLPRPRYRCGLECNGLTDLDILGDSTIAFPYFNPRTHEVESGFYCAACVDKYECHLLEIDSIFPGPTRKFAVDTYKTHMKETILQHFAECQGRRWNFDPRELREQSSYLIAKREVVHINND